VDRIASMNAFVKVVDYKGFTAAAERLKLSPTMVSNHIRSLEETLGARLLNRTTRKVGLTDVGRIYYERCQQILSEIEDADRIAGADASVPRGVVRLNVSTAIAPFLADPIADFVGRYPECSVVLTTSDRMVDMVEEGFDLAVRSLPVRDTSLIMRKLTSFRFTVCGAPSYLKRRGTPRQLSDLADHNCLIYSHSPWGNEWPFRGPKGPQMIPVHGNLQTNSPQTLRTAALNGLGLVFAPEFMSAQDIADGLIVPVLTKFSPPEHDINAYYPHRRLLSAKVRSLIDVLTACFSAKCAFSAKTEAAKSEGRHAARRRSPPENRPSGVRSEVG
jgi:DNA-binding transcriptional LysR family regulator